ncbi:MAG: pilin [Patescibacteria group bacterium]
MKILKKYKVVSLLTIFALASVFAVNSAFAAVGDGGGSTPRPDGGGSTPPPAKIVPLQNPLNNINSIDGLLYKFVDLAIFIGVIIAVFMFFWVGFKFVMARGNETELADAKKWFFYAVIGTAILISSKVIVEVLKNTLTNAGVVKEGQFNQNQ